MTTDILIKTYPGDYEWLRYCLRSIQRFATGFRRTVVIVPDGAEKPPTGDAEDVHYVHEYGEGYMFQQVVKLHADAFTDAEFICYMDADTIFTRHVCPEHLIDDMRRPRWLYTPYSSINSGDGQTWKAPTEKLMNGPVDHEFMRRHPFVVSRKMLEGFRLWMMRSHRMTVERYVMTQPNREFSEFNALGAWLWFYHGYVVEWMNTDENMGTTFVHQSYSWGGLSDAIRVNLEAALA